MSEQKVITLICERACDLDAACDDKGQVKEIEGLQVVKLPCSGMIQPLMIEAAMKAGAAGVIVTGCQIGDCYYREGNRMIRERLLGMRPPGLKKTVDRRRILALWLSRPQTDRFLSEAKEFVGMVRQLPAAEPAPAKPAPAPKPAQ
jgi:coenzyme F420-reducing hydrogenase delta subunit